MNYDPAVWFWTCVAVVAWGVSLVLVYKDSRRFSRVEYAIKLAKAVRYGPRWWIAIGFLVADSLFLFGWFGWIIPGVVAIMTPSPARDRTVLETFFLYQFIFTEAIFGSIQLWWWFVRTRLSKLTRVRV
jgi:hypothetical protein